MTDVNIILDNATQWATEGVTKPTIKTGQIYSIKLMSRGIVVKRVTSEDELIGIIDRNAYSINSNEAWIVDIVSSTSKDDLDDIIECIKRILAEYTQVSGEETYLTWQGGDFKPFNNVRWEFRFVILRMKSLQTEF